MKKVRDELAAWRVALREVAPDLLTGILPWLERFQSFLGPHLLPRAGESGEPEGYEGLATTGPWERLLASEWALLEAAPLEFLRRSMAAEQLRFALASQRPFGARRCIALVDAGPSQLGNARLAQIALLAVLAERARAVGSELEWSAWQAEPGQLASGFESASLSHFLQQRSFSSVKGDRVAAWLAALGEPLEGEERWSLGAERRSGMVGFRQVSIREAEPREAQMLEVEWQPVGQPPRSLELRLPAEVERVRWLREPCRTVRGSLLEGRIRGVRFGSYAERLLVRVEKGLVVYHLPKDLTAPSGRTRFFDLAEGERLVAAGNTGARLLVVVKTGEMLAFHRVDREERRDPEPLMIEAQEVEPWQGDEGFGICLADPAAPKKLIFFEDGHRCVQGIDVQERRIAVPRRQASALYFAANQGVVTLGRRGSEALAIWDPALGEWKTSLATKHPGFQTAFAGYASSFALHFARLGKERWPVAFEIEKDVWAMGGQQVLRPGASSKVVGVAVDPAAESLGLLAIEPDGRSLVHLGLTLSRILFRALSPIRGVTVASERPILALWTEGRALEVISLADGRNCTLREEET